MESLIKGLIKRGSQGAVYRYVEYRLFAKYKIK